MNKYLYRRVRAEQDEYPTPQEAIIDHINMAIVHTHLNFEGEDADELMLSLNKCILNIQRAQEPEKIKRGASLGAIRDYMTFDDKEEAARPVEEKIVGVNSEGPKEEQPTMVDAMEAIASILVEDMNVNNRVKTALKAQGINTIRELMAVPLVDIHTRTGIGTKSLLDVMACVKRDYGLNMEIGSVPKETRARPASKKGHMMNKAL